MTLEMTPEQNWYFCCLDRQLWDLQNSTGGKHQNDNEKRIEQYPDIPSIAFQNKAIPSRIQSLFSCCTDLNSYYYVIVTVISSYETGMALAV